MTRSIIEADLTWTGDAFQRGVQVMVNEGRIEATGALGLQPTHRLEGQALLPGFVSAHSHAFQRELRGRTGGKDSFWSWRDEMYKLVASLDEQSFYDATLGTFREMRAKGITTVGEFHYFHDGYRFDEIVLRAARDANIRLVLLMTYYKTGGIDKPLEPAQKRFETRTLDEFFAHIDRLRHPERSSGPGRGMGTTPPSHPTQLPSDARNDSCSIGIAAHSIRGVPVDEIVTLYSEARRRGMPFHMHLEEQRREIEECRAAYGATPLALINQRLKTCEGFTAVHATHSDPEEMQRFLDRGGSVCITPLTEANLGDGIPDVSAIAKHPHRLSLGTDSNARISMIEEMRWLEYAQRLKSESRGVFDNLLHFATAGGARALGIDAGRIAPGAHADFVAIDAPESIDAVIFGAGDEVIRSTCVAGRWE